VTPLTTMWGCAHETGYGTSSSSPIPGADGYVVAVPSEDQN